MLFYNIPARQANAAGGCLDPPTFHWQQHHDNLKQAPSNRRACCRTVQNSCISNHYIAGVDGEMHFARLRSVGRGCSHSGLCFLLCIARPHIIRMCKSKFSVQPMLAAVSSWKGTQAPVLGRCVCQVVHSEHLGRACYDSLSHHSVCGRQFGTPQRVPSSVTSSKQSALSV